MLEIQRLTGLDSERTHSCPIEHEQLLTSEGIHSLGNKYVTPETTNSTLAFLSNGA